MEKAWSISILVKQTSLWVNTQRFIMGKKIQKRIVHCIRYIYYNTSRYLVQKHHLLFFMCSSLENCLGLQVALPGQSDPPDFCRRYVVQYASFTSNCVKNWFGIQWTLRASGESLNTKVAKGGSVPASLNSLPSANVNQHSLPEKKKIIYKKFPGLLKKCPY